MRPESISARLVKEKHFIVCFKPKLNAYRVYIDKLVINVH